MMKNLIARILAWFGGEGVQRIIKSIPEIVAKVEDDYKKALADGIITPIERKELAVATVNAAAEVLGVKMTWVTRWIIDVIIDNVAKQLPSKDINIPDILFKVKMTF